MKVKDSFMKQEGTKVERRHVIEKIRRISLSMDRGESWTLILLTALFGVMILGLIYFLML
jgi:hypothetical protein